MNGTADGCDFSEDVKENVVELPSDCLIEDMVQIAEKATATQESGGIIMRDKANIKDTELFSVIEGPLGPPVNNGEASYDYIPTIFSASILKSWGGLQTVFHAHNKDKSYLQSPHAKDIENSTIIPLYGDRC